MDHWHSGDKEPMPIFMDRLMAGNSAAGGGATGRTDVEVSINHGAGEYEQQFSLYWLSFAWVLLGFHIMAMLILLYQMAVNNSGYVWVSHLTGTAIIDCSVAITAIVYRYVLFPAPGYYTRLPPGAHTIEVRSGRLPPLRLDVRLEPGEQMQLKHEFATPPAPPPPRRVRPKEPERPDLIEQLKDRWKRLW